MLKKTNKNERLTDAQKANKAIDEAFYEDGQEVNQKQTNAESSSATAKTNEALNQQFSDKNKQDNLTPASYMYNNTPAIDVTKDKDNNR